MISLASVHSYTAENLPFGRELASAEEEAKAARKGVSVPAALGTSIDLQLWSSYSGEEVQETKEDATAALAPEYLDVYVSAVRDSDPFGFSVQILDDKS